MTQNPLLSGSSESPQMVTLRDHSRLVVACLVVRTFCPVDVRRNRVDKYIVAAAEPLTDKAAIDEAEKRIGKKEE